MVDPLMGPDVLGGHPPGQGLGVKADTAAGGVGILIEELEPDPADARPQQRRQGFHARLRRSIEQRVATTQIGTQGMFDAAPIPQGDVVLLAGPTTVGVVLAVREERTEQACSMWNRGMC